MLRRLSIILFTLGGIVTAFLFLFFAVIAFAVMLPALILLAIDTKVRVRKFNEGSRKNSATTDQTSSNTASEDAKVIDVEYDENSDSYKPDNSFMKKPIKWLRDFLNKFAD